MHLSADMLVSKDHSYGVRRLVQYVEKVLGYKRLVGKAGSGNVEGKGWGVGAIRCN